MEDFVTFKIAKKLKEKGFSLNNEDVELIGCRFIFSDKCTIKRISTIGAYDKGYFGENIDCPTISQVLKWLRTEKNIDIVIYPVDANTVFMGGEKYILSIYINGKRDYKIHHDNIDKYVQWEDAAIAGIEYSLNNLI